MMNAIASRDMDPIAVLQEEYVNAVRGSDVGTLTGMFCEDAVFMPPNEASLYGRPAIEAWWHDYFAHFKVTALTITERTATITDGLAVERRGHVIAILPVKSKDLIRDDGRGVFVWKREPDGSWRIAQLIFNSTQPIGSGTSRFLARMKAQESPE